MDVASHKTHAQKNNNNNNNNNDDDDENEFSFGLRQEPRLV
jgi:hypothetical protein